MTYCLGVDLGTTYSAAAVWRRGHVAPSPLGHATSVVPSVLFLTDENEMLVGEAAERRAQSEPAALAREFKRRMGDPVPVVLRSTAIAVEELTSRLLRWVVDRVVELEGSAPTAMAVTHPANWGEHRRSTLRRSIELAGFDEVKLLPEPEAAAIDYATKERLSPGDRVAVYDLGGGTFDVAILELDEVNGYRVLGSPQGIDHLGGADFDQMLVNFVCRAAGLDPRTLDAGDLRVSRQLAALRTACVEAKIDLSANTATAVVVSVGQLDTEVRITRAEFEHLIQRPVSATIEAVDRALASAHVKPEDIRAVLLVGGSSRVPQIGRAVSAALGRPVAVDAHSKHAVSMGAASWAAEASGLGTGTSGISRIDRGASGDARPAHRSVRRAGEPEREDEGRSGRGPGGLPSDVAAQPSLRRSTAPSAADSVPMKSSEPVAFSDPGDASGPPASAHLPDAPCPPTAAGGVIDLRGPLVTPSREDAAAWLDQPASPPSVGAQPSSVEGQPPSAGAPPPMPPAPVEPLTAGPDPLDPGGGGGASPPVAAPPAGSPSVAAPPAGSPSVPSHGLPLAPPVEERAAQQSDRWQRDRVAPQGSGLRRDRRPPPVSRPAAEPTPVFVTPAPSVPSRGSAGTRIAALAAVVLVIVIVVL
ncbi:MAG: molecular chaperone DnaK, partial [Acidimicrobiia bacterium]|nr:molecular chaperone DnaK [Acidimicrobiia bacterium]